MLKSIGKNILWIFILFLCISFLSLNASEQFGTFYVLNKEQGLHGKNVLQMLQLEDGRIVIVTDTHVNIYDGQHFRALPFNSNNADSLIGYKGFTHLYVDANHRLWIKDWQHVSCVDLPTLHFVNNCCRLLDKGKVDDFFVDSDGGIWIVRKGRVSRSDGSLMLQNTEKATVHDIDVNGLHVYLFCADGAVSIFSTVDGHFESRCPSYSRNREHLYDLTSLVRRTSDGRFLQVRTHDRSILQVFDPHVQRWKELLESEEVFHTLTVGWGGLAYVTTSQGYFTMNLRTGQISRLDSLRLPDGTYLTTGLNTVCIDREGGVWLGSYERGLLYASPLSGVFDTEETSVRLTPILTSATANGRLLLAGTEEMHEDSPFANVLHLKSDLKTLTLTFNSMKYVHSRNVVYRYRLRERDIDWHTVGPDSIGGSVDDEGIFTLTLTDLPYGISTLEVEASPANAPLWNGGLCRLTLEIASPWWMSFWAWIVAVVLLICACIVSVRIYTRRARRKSLQRSREEMLLLRIQELIEKCNQYESAMSVVLTEKEDSSGKPEMNAAERDFLRRATTFVEQHLQDSTYSVEQLSRDLCMERTGLYRKLMVIMDKSPQTFIRSIRLEKASQLLSEAGMSVADVAEATGFSSTSYFSKCFQKEYGHKPSEHFLST